MYADIDKQPSKQWKQVNLQLIQQIKLDDSNSTASLFDAIKAVVENAVKILRNNNTDTKYIAIVDLILLRFKAIINNKLVDNNLLLSNFKSTITKKLQTSSIKIQDINDILADAINNSTILKDVAKNNSKTDDAANNETRQQINKTDTPSNVSVKQIAVHNNQKQMQLLNNSLNNLNAIISKFTNIVATNIETRYLKKDSTSIDNSSTTAVNITKKTLKVIKHCYTILNKLQQTSDQIIKNFKDVIVNYQKNIDNLKNMSADMVIAAKARKKNSIFEKVFDIIKKRIKNTVVNMLKKNKHIAKFFNFFNRVFKRIKNILNKFINKLKSIFKIVFDTLKLVFKAIKKIVLYPFKLLLKGFRATIKFILNGIKLLLKGIWYAIKFLVSVVWAALKAIFKFIYKILSKVLKTIYKFFKKILTKIVDFVKSKLKNFLNKLSQFKQKIINIIKGLKQRITKFISKIKNVIKNFIKKTISKVKDVLKKIIQKSIGKVKTIVQKIAKKIAKKLGKKVAKQAAKKVGKKFGMKILSKLLKKVITTILKKVVVRLGASAAVNLIPGLGQLVYVGMLLWTIYDIVKTVLDIYTEFKNNPGLWDQLKVIIVDWVKEHCGKYLEKMLEWGKKLFNWIFIEGPKMLLAAAGKALKALARAVLHPIDTAKIADQMRDHAKEMEQLKKKNLAEFNKKSTAEKYAYWEANFQRDKAFIFEQLKKIEELDNQINDELMVPYRLVGRSYNSDWVFNLVGNKKMAIWQFVNAGTHLGLNQITPQELDKIELKLKEREQAKQRAEMLKKEYEHYLELNNKEINLLELNTIINEGKEENRKFLKNVDDFAKYLKNNYEYYYNQLKPYIDEETVMDYIDTDMNVSLNGQKLSNINVDDVNDSNDDLDVDDED